METSEVSGLFRACGFNSVGILTSAGIGKALAFWIKEGHAPVDLTDVDVLRMQPFQSCAESHGCDRSGERRHPMIVGKLSLGASARVPCTPLVCMLLIKRVRAELAGPNAVIVGRSEIDGKPLAQFCFERIAISRSHTLRVKIFL
ncbi:hypothetical protein I6F16_34075 [Bradyrhizobium sp. IC4060]|nr:hypothetical protein [Bradyrhizobium sp. IC4060]